MRLLGASDWQNEINLFVVSFQPPVLFKCKNIFWLWKFSLSLVVICLTDSSCRVHAPTADPAGRIWIVCNCKSNLWSWNVNYRQTVDQTSKEDMLEGYGRIWQFFANLGIHILWYQCGPLRDIVSYQPTVYGWSALLGFSIPDKMMWR